MERSQSEPPSPALLPSRVAVALALVLLSIELLPSGPSGTLIVLGATLCWQALRGYHRIACATLGGGVIGALALVDATAWLGTALVLIGVSALQGGARERRAPIALALGIGVLFPLLLLGSMAALDPDARHALLAGIDLPSTAAERARRAATLLAVIGLAAEAQRWSRANAACLREPVTLSSTSRVERAALFGLAGALVAWLALRGWWIESVVSLRTDMLIWSERPLLVNLLKLRAGEPFYGPPELVNSYAYSPGLELLQYGLLRPWGLELSLLAHRWLGLAWQLGTSAVLVAALRARGLPSKAAWLVAAGVTVVVCSSLLAPHVHPDHAMMLAFSGALWLVLDDAKLDRRRAALLLAVPVLATVFKLTGAGIGLGLAAAYAWERDRQRLLLLAVAGAVALGTIPLFDATLGSFSRYAIQLQASHPLEWGRAWSIPTSPSGALWGLALCVLAARWWQAPHTPVTRAATRAALLTAGFGVTSLLGYVKHGGRENSLLPLAIGGVVVLVLCALVDDRGAAPRVALPLTAVPRAALVLAIGLIATPAFAPISPSDRARLASMHERQVAWLRSGKARHLRFWSSSISAAIDAGERTVPRDVLSSAVELELAKQPAVTWFTQRVERGVYDGLALQSSVLFDTQSFGKLRAALASGFRVAGPPELGGHWPKDRTGYVLLERSAPTR